MAYCLRCHDGKQASGACETCHRPTHAPRGACTQCHPSNDFAKVYCSCHGGNVPSGD